ncbi:TPA: glycosyltransferase, partial [Escherichia coli]|nr:glycosyltransferase [Escherichia coli]
MSLNKQKTKIVHVQLMPLLSGVQRVSLQEIERLPKNEYEISVICKEPGPLVDGLREDINKFYIPSLCREISLINDLRSLYLLYKNFKREKYDIVHTHSSKTGVLGRVAAKLAGVPCIIHTVHGFAFESAKRSYVRLLYRILERIGAKCSTKIICLHEDDKK